jgi:hypothetical protein
MCARRTFRRTRRRLDRRLKRLAGWHGHRTATGRSLDLGQVLGDAFEVFGQVAARPRDVSKRTARTCEPAEPFGRSLTGTPGSAGSLGTTSGRSGAVHCRARFASSGEKKHGRVEEVLTGAQTRPGFTPNFKVQ